MTSDIDKLKAAFGFALIKAMSQPGKKIWGYELAEAAGLSEQSITNYRNGSSIPSPKYMTKIMDYLYQLKIDERVTDDLSNAWGRCRKGGKLEAEPALTDWEHDVIDETRQLTLQQKKQLKMFLSQMLEDNRFRMAQNAGLENDYYEGNSDHPNPTYPEGVPSKSYSIRDSASAPDQKSNRKRDKKSQ